MTKKALPNQLALRTGGTFAGDVSEGLHFAAMVIYLHDRRGWMAEWSMKIQHFCAGVPLLLVGINHLHEEGERAIALFEISLSAGVLFTFIADLRALRRTRAGHPHHAKISWFDLAAGAMLIFEAFHGHNAKPGYMRPQFILGLIAVSQGIFHGPFERFRQHRRYVKLDDHGAQVRQNRFHKLSWQWSQLAAVESNPTMLTLRRNDGQEHFLKLSRFSNREAVFRAIVEQAKAAGIAVTTAEANEAIESRRAAPSAQETLH